MKRIVRRSRSRIAIPAAVLTASVLANAAYAASYEYDSLGRVVKVTYDDGSVVTYAYDASGNRITVSATKS